tara:strand:- start:1739 stop:1990 length:252 start_codon:yes stop_codon:yes gene_type:complete
MQNENRILRKNVKDLQGQLTNANIRIAKLTEELHQVRKELNPFDPRNSDSKWAELPNENLEEEHIEDNKNQFKLNLKEEKENE